MLCIACYQCILGSLSRRMCMYLLYCFMYLVDMHFSIFHFKGNNRYYIHCKHLNVCMRCNLKYKQYISNQSIRSPLNILCMLLNYHSYIQLDKNGNILFFCNIRSRTHHTISYYCMYYIQSSMALRKSLHSKYNIHLELYLNMSSVYPWNLKLMLILYCTKRS